MRSLFGAQKNGKEIFGLKKKSQDDVLNSGI